LRRNAAHLFATWLANNRGMNADELAALLFQVMWSPAARELADDNSRLRALTEIEQPAGVGLACQRFRQQVIEARTSQDQALRDALDLRLRVAETDGQRLLAEEHRDALAAELHALRESSAAEAAELRRQHEVERTHLRHDQEQLRGRMVRRLDEGVEMLEVGLTALRNKTPRVEVMLERAEHVVDALRAETRPMTSSPAPAWACRGAPCARPRRCWDARNRSLTASGAIRCRWWSTCWTMCGASCCRPRPDGT